MKKILLTSTGFSNMKFSDMFIRSIGKRAAEIKVIFIPTAAISDDAREMLPYCYEDLINAGILPANIFTYDLRYIVSKNCDNALRIDQARVPACFRLLSAEEIGAYDGVYLCGGDTKYLLNEVNRTGFRDILLQAIENGLFYIGTSAGAVIAAGNYKDNLGFIPNILNVHCQKGTPNGKLQENSTVNLTNQQAIWITENSCEIIE